MMPGQGLRRCICLCRTRCLTDDDPFIDLHWSVPGRTAVRCLSDDVGVGIGGFLRFDRKGEDMGRENPFFCLTFVKSID